MGRLFLHKMKYLKHLLEKNDKSPYWLVQKLNSNYTVVNKLINNEAVGIQFKTIDKLLTIFDCKVEELIVKK